MLQTEMLAWHQVDAESESRGMLLVKSIATKHGIKTEKVDPD